jgi:hypothetical protein
MDFILESEQRVGSRWVHYLLSDLLGMRPSPEIDGNRILQDNRWAQTRIRELWRQNRIPKLHHIHILDLRHALYPFAKYKHLTIVRNPRDRAVSVAFHHKHDPGRAQWAQRGMEDKEAVRYTVLEYDRYNISNIRMLSNMVYGSSSHSSTDKYGKSKMWVAYEWLLEDPVREFNSIVSFLGRDTAMSVEEAVDLHSFEKKTKRKQGQEKRTDVWRRKGVNKDWENWFDQDMIDATEYLQEQYYQKLNME